jgi:hypothetical protein
MWSDLAGVTLLKELIPLMKEYHPELAKKITTIGVGVKNKTVKFETKFPEREVAKKCVLLFDSSMHTGGTMRRCVAEAMRLGASGVADFVCAQAVRRQDCQASLLNVPANRNAALATCFVLMKKQAVRSQRKSIRCVRDCALGSVIWMRAAHRAATTFAFFNAGQATSIFRTSSVQFIYLFGRRKSAEI